MTYEHNAFNQAAALWRELGLPEEELRGERSNRFSCLMVWLSATYSKGRRHGYEIAWDKIRRRDDIG